MSPVPAPELDTRTNNNYGNVTESPEQVFAAQWANPNDIFSVLLILGGDVVARALAQLAGSTLTPVAFSFGWVAYAITAVVSAVGENRLMPTADCNVKVINGRTGYVRDNTSWIIGRLVRDFDSWMDPATKSALKRILLDRWADTKEKAELETPGSSKQVPKPTQAGLCVSFYRAMPARRGFAGRDESFYSGFFTAMLQFVVSALPWILWGDWTVFLLVSAGITLSFCQASLPPLSRQWAREKWAARISQSDKMVVLTPGNGSQHAIVISSPKDIGIDLEDLARGQTNMNVSASYSTRLLTVGFAGLWIALLITAAGLQGNTWFLVACGGIGIIQNIFVAGRARKPDAFGVPLVFEACIAHHAVMRTLVEVEKRYPDVGWSMRDTFFPGKLRKAEREEWRKLRLRSRKVKEESENESEDENDGESENESEHDKQVGVSTSSASLSASVSGSRSRDHSRHCDEQEDARISLTAAHAAHINMSEKKQQQQQITVRDRPAS